MSHREVCLFYLFWSYKPLGLMFCCLAMTFTHFCMSKVPLLEATVNSKSGLGSRSTAQVQRASKSFSSCYWLCVSMAAFSWLPLLLTEMEGPVLEPGFLDRRIQMQWMFWDLEVEIGRLHLPRQLLAPPHPLVWPPAVPGPRSPLSLGWSSSWVGLWAW